MEVRGRLRRIVAVRSNKSTRQAAEAAARRLASFQDQRRSVGYRGHNQAAQRTLTARLAVLSPYPTYQAVVVSCR
jgi:hypothetical protein